MSVADANNQPSQIGRLAVVLSEAAFNLSEIMSINKQTRPNIGEPKYSHQQKQ